MDNGYGELIKYLNCLNPNSINTQPKIVKAYVDFVTLFPTYHNV